MFEEKIKEALKTAGLKIKKIVLETPRQGFGDYAFPCFMLAKTMKKNPNEIAKEIAERLKKLPKEISKVEASGGYINFFINKEIFLKSTVEKILKEKESYGSLRVPKLKAIIEHTSLNPNSSPHVGRIRNAIIGDIISRLLHFHGYRTEVHFYVNDFSKQVALMLLGFKGDETFDQMLNLYVKMTARLEHEPEIEKQVFEILEKIEMQDMNEIKRMNKLVKICTEGQKKILARLGINYNSFDLESKYMGKAMTINLLKKLEKTKRLKKDLEGRYYLDLNDLKNFKNEMKSPVLVLTRSNGIPLYPFRDILYTIDKLKSAPLNIIVLGEDQKLYFKQLAAVLELLGYTAPRAVHYSYTLIKTKEGAKKMSTRKGEIILASNFMDEAVKKAKEEIKKRHREKKVALEKVAEAVGIGAIRYSISKVELNKAIVFDWEEALNFEGNSSPYLQYSYTRACGILKKLAAKKLKPKYENIDEKEYALAKQLANFPSVAQASLEQFAPHIITNYVYKLAQLFNDFYEKCPVIRAEPGVKERRVLLVRATKQVLSTCLNLLGIPRLEAM